MMNLTEFLESGSLDHFLKVPYRIFLIKLRGVYSVVDLVTRRLFESGVYSGPLFYFYSLNSWY